jgi:hypothetical protein
VARDLPARHAVMTGPMALESATGPVPLDNDTRP